MSELWKVLLPLAPYVAIVVVVLLLTGVVALVVGYVIAPSRTRKTVDYLLNTFRLAKAAKGGPTDAPLEVPNFETAMPFKAVPPPEKKP
jgi:hypothetical protein